MGRNGDQTNNNTSFPAYSVEERKKRKTKFQVFARKGKMSKLFFVLCLFVVAAMAKPSKLLGAVKLRQAEADCCADCRCGNRCHNCPMFDKDLAVRAADCGDDCDGICVPGPFNPETGVAESVCMKEGAPASRT